MRKVLFILGLIVILQSCVFFDFDDNYEVVGIASWVWWALAIFVIIIVYSIISGNKEVKDTQEKLAKSGLSLDDFFDTKSTYVGGHPEQDVNLKNILYRKNENELLFYSRETQLSEPVYKFSISIDNVENILIEDASSMENKITLGRFILVGVFALAWRKKKKNELAFVIIDWKDNKFSHSTIFNFEAKDAMQLANTFRNKLIKDCK